MTKGIAISALLAACVLSSCNWFQGSPPVVHQRAIPVVTTMPDLVTVPPPILRKGDVRLYLGGQAYVKGKTFTGTVTQVQPGRIDFSDGHILYYRLSLRPQTGAGNSFPIKPNDVVVVDFKITYFHVSIFHSVRVTTPAGELLMELSQGGGIQPVEVSIAGDSLVQTRTVDPISTDSTGSELFSYLITQFKSPGQPPTQEVIGTDFSHTVGANTYRVNIQQSSLTEYQDPGLAGEGPPYHLYFSVLRQ